MNLNAVDDFIFPGVLFINGILVVILITTVVTRIVRRNNWLEKLELTPVQLDVDKLVNELANCLTKAWLEVLNLDVLNVREPKLLEIIDHFGESIIKLALKVLEVDKYSLFLALKNKVSDFQNCTYLFLVKTDQPVDHVVKHVDAVSFVLVQWRVCPVDP